MAAIYVLQSASRCSTCGAHLPAGSKVRFIAGRLVGIGCHRQPPTPQRVSTRVAHLARSLGFEVTRALQDDGLVRLTVRGTFPGPAQRLPGEVRREAPLLILGGYSKTLTWIYVDPTVALAHESRN